jgi:membrane dipeptidase
VALGRLLGIRRAVASAVLAIVVAGCRGGATEATPDATAAPVVASPPAEVVAPVVEPPARDQPPTDLDALVPWLGEHAILVDGHVDLPWRLLKSANPDGSASEDVTTRTDAGDFDYPRAKAGGMDAPFMSIYVAASFEGAGAKAHADQLIAQVEALAKRAPDKFALARSPDDVRRNRERGLVSLPMGMENGAPLEGDLANVAYFHGRGIRYITLAHSKDNHLSDSSFDTRHTHRGLSAFGKQVVAEMNRVGIIIDVSHLSDDAFWQVMATSRAPVLATHSSCRHFTPGFERNMSDDMIRALADNGGVIMINFGSDFLRGDVRAARKRHEAQVARGLKKARLAADSDEGRAWVAKYEAEHPAPRATVHDVADHIEHVIGIVGVDHVGLGSDFDGVGDSLPEGLRDVSEYPNLVRVLLERGHTVDNLQKILGGNALRVWEQVEAHAAKRD